MPFKKAFYQQMLLVKDKCLAKQQQKILKRFLQSFFVVAGSAEVLNEILLNVFPSKKEDSVSLRLVILTTYVQLVKKFLNKNI